MGRCILVLGTGGCGTTILSKVLEGMGVDFGDDLLSSMEDKEFTDAIKDHTPPNSILARFIGKEIFGLKHPLAGKYLSHYCWMFNEMRVIHIVRPIDLCAQAVVRRQAGACTEPPYTPMKLSEIRRNNLDFLDTFSGHVLEIEFRELTDFPYDTCLRIKQFAFCGLEYSLSILPQVVELIDKGMRHA